MASRIWNLRAPLQRVIKRNTILNLNKSWNRSMNVISPQKNVVNLPPTQLTELSCGMKVASEDTGAPTATVGVWIDAGSRYELERMNGTAHFLEHMVFKGTSKRSQVELELEIENMGAHLNAYTSREQTVFYTKCLRQDIPKAVEILSDILSNAKLAEADIENERGVILREMQEVETNLQEIVFDYLHAAAYQDTPLGKTILGPTDNIKKISQTDLRNYGNLFYKPARMILAGAGGVDHQELVDLGNKYFGPIQPASMDDPLAQDLESEIEQCRYTGSEIKHRDDALPFCYAALAFEGAGWTNADSIPLMLASTIIGAWDRTQGVHSHHASFIARAAASGEAMSYQAFNTCYKDTGLWGIYWVCEREKTSEFTGSIFIELRRLCLALTQPDLERGKNLLKTSLLLQLDGTTPICEDIGRQMLCYNRRIPYHELEARIDAVTKDELQDVFMNYIYDQCPAFAAVGATGDCEDYEIMRGKTIFIPY